MFRGNCPTRLDEKGRLKIPADFKHEIDRAYDSQFYLTSRDKKVIELYPLKEWEQIEDRLAKLPTSNLAVLNRMEIRPMDEFAEYVNANSISDEENDQLSDLGI